MSKLWVISLNASKMLVTIGLALINCVRCNALRLAYGLLLYLCVYNLYRKPEYVKSGSFSVLIQCGETSALPLDQLSAVVDHVS